MIVTNEWLLILRLQLPQGPTYYNTPCLGNFFYVGHHLITEIITQPIFLQGITHIKSVAAPKSDIWYHIEQQWMILNIKNLTFDKYPWIRLSSLLPTNPKQRIINYSGELMTTKTKKRISTIKYNSKRFSLICNRLCWLDKSELTTKRRETIDSQLKNISLGFFGCNQS